PSEWPDAQGKLADLYAPSLSAEEALRLTTSSLEPKATNETLITIQACDCFRLRLGEGIVESGEESLGLLITVMRETSEILLAVMLFSSLALRTGSLREAASPMRRAGSRRRVSLRHRSR